VWLDLVERDRSRRYKMTRWREHRLELAASSDGIHWREMGTSGRSGDRSTFFYNPFRQLWVFSLRNETTLHEARVRRYWETPDFFGGVNWKPEEPVLWAHADSADPPKHGMEDVAVELYNLDCVAYESVLLGLFTIFRGEPIWREKPNDICAG